jgi:hypothetical protein
MIEREDFLVSVLAVSCVHHKYAHILYFAVPWWTVLKSVKGVPCATRKVGVNDGFSIFDMIHCWTWIIHTLVLLLYIVLCNCTHNT